LDLRRYCSTLFAESYTVLGARGSGVPSRAVHPSCINCGSGHLSANKKCLVFVNKKNIQELKVKEGLTFPEARK
jgi:hypothetical protein